MTGTSVATVGVVGAGVIGASMAEAVTAGGIDVVLHDRSAEALHRAGSAITGGRRLARLRGARAAGPVGAVEQTTELADLRRVDLIIENVTESEACKVEVHQRIDELVDPAVVVAVNTSAIPVTRLALVTRHPGRVVGAHFMNPVGLIDTVEVVATPVMDPDTMPRLLAFLRQLGKDGVVVADSSGFVINRCLMPLINEAASLLEDTGTEPAEVDRLFKGCLGHSTGPLRTADIIGVDTVVATLDVLERYYRSDRFSACPRLRRMVDAGWTGAKAGRGFFTYDDTSGG